MFFRRYTLLRCVIVSVFLCRRLKIYTSRILLCETKLFYITSTIIFIIILILLFFFLFLLLLLRIISFYFLPIIFIFLILLRAMDIFCEFHYCLRPINKLCLFIAYTFIIYTVSHFFLTF